TISIWGWTQEAMELMLFSGLFSGRDYKKIPAELKLLGKKQTSSFFSLLMLLLELRLKRLMFGMLSLDSIFITARAEKGWSTSFFILYIWPLMTFFVAIHIVY
ncbi:hypothetical protein ACJX0J_027593, partial [Zea mays]